jgi:hypothetical protein
VVPDGGLQRSRNGRMTVAEAAAFMSPAFALSPAGDLFTGMLQGLVVLRARQLLTAM